MASLLVIYVGNEKSQDQNQKLLLSSSVALIS